MSFLIASGVAIATNEEHLTVNNPFTHTEEKCSRLIIQISYLKRSGV